MSRLLVSLPSVLLAALRLSAADAEPIAIVYGLTGQALVRAAPASPPRPAQRFEWLPVAAELEVGKGATLLLAFASGVRYELGEGAKVTLVAPDGFRASTGPVRALSSVSPLPRLATLAADTLPGTRAGALRIRGSRIAGLYPRDEASALPNEATLSWGSLPGTPSYKVQVEDESGNAVFDAEVRTSSVVLSPGVLKPGARYHWTVRSLGGASSARGEADFSVLTTESLAARTELRRSLHGLLDPESLALLAEVDSRLGLFVEAQHGFRAALAQAPGDHTLQAALDKLDGQISAVGRDPQP